MSASRATRKSPVWEKPTPELEAIFDAALPSEPAVERRRMFGYPCAFVKGQLFTGVHNGKIMVRLGDDKRAELLGLPGAAPFEPMPGRIMREYAVVPAGFLRRRRVLADWMAEALRYAVSLPPKKPKRRRASRA